VRQVGDLVVGRPVRRRSDATERLDPPGGDASVDVGAAAGLREPEPLRCRDVGQDLVAGIVSVRPTLPGERSTERRPALREPVLVDVAAQVLGELAREVPPGRDPRRPDLRAYAFPRPTMRSIAWESSRRPAALISASRSRALVQLDDVTTPAAFAAASMSPTVFRSATAVRISS
jgi:hypothetical protein